MRRRLVRVLLGGLAALAVLEGALQVWRQLDPRVLQTDRPPATAAAGKRLLLCIGDSHTFGLAVDHDLQSYPAHLRGLLGGADPDGRFTVASLGVPGHNAAQVYHLLRRSLGQGRPDLVLVLAGLDDSWNPSTGGSLADDAPRTGGARLLLPRLVRFLVARVRPPPLVLDRVEQRDDGFYLVGQDGLATPVDGDPPAREERLLGAALQRQVEARLAEIVSLCRDHGVPLVLQTYACERSEKFLLVNAAARTVAARMQVPLIDHAAWFRERLDLDYLQAFQPDGHLTGAGHLRMAQGVLRFLHDHPSFQGWPLAPRPSGDAP